MLVRVIRPASNPCPVQTIGSNARRRSNTILLLQLFQPQFHFITLRGRRDIEVVFQLAPRLNNLALTRQHLRHNQVPSRKINVALA